MMDTSGIQVFLISVSTSIVFSFVIAGYRNRKIKLQNEERLQITQNVLSSRNDSWKKVGTVSELWSYPLKSGKGRKLEFADFTECGISIREEGILTLRDRMFLLFDKETKRFATARQYPKLVLVEVSAQAEDRVLFKYGDSTFSFNLPGESNKNSLKFFECTMWFKERVRCIDCGDEASRWISRLLTDGEKELGLGIYIPEFKRIVTEGAWKNFAENYIHLRDEDTGLFSDLASYMLLSESSVQELNDRLDRSIKPAQFRPNVVIKGCEPYAEDEWDWIKIGDSVIIRKVKFCTRCTMITIDPDSGERDPESEPLKTLRTYRRLRNPEHDKLENHAPSFGIYCGLYRSGRVNLNDEVYIYQDSHEK